jgi:hypothetical protein
MEFLDINFTKSLSFFAPFYSQSLLLADFKKPILFFGLKNPYQKICETRKLGSIHGHNFVEYKRRVENQTKLESEKIRVYA